MRYKHTIGIQQKKIERFKNKLTWVKKSNIAKNGNYKHI